jgi:hypothetical protein
MLSHTVRDLHNRRRLPVSPPSEVRNLESVVAVERKIFAPHAGVPPAARTLQPEYYKLNHPVDSLLTLPPAAR